ncbi:MAG: hypothetical protein ACFFAU_16925 [Candidatus Hodarchaeota archaeon]
MGTNFRLIFIIGGIGILMMSSLVLLLYTFQLSVQNNPTEAPFTEDNPALNPSTATFNDFWSLDIQLNRANYSLGENMTLIMNLTCLMDHNVTDYLLGSWWGLTRLKNSSGHVVWEPDYFPPGIIYGIYEFKQGYCFCRNTVLYLGTALEKPSSIDGAFWVPPLPNGQYIHKIVPPPAYCATFSGISVNLPFKII